MCASEPKKYGVKIVSEGAWTTVRRSGTVRVCRHTDEAAAAVFCRADEPERAGATAAVAVMEKPPPDPPRRSSPSRGWWSHSDAA